MAMRRWFLFCGLVLGACLATQVVSPLWAQQDADSAQSPSAQSPSEVPDDETRELNIRYAESYLKLMQAQLAELEERNRRVPNLIRPAVVQLVQQNVAKARQRVEALQRDEAHKAQTQVMRAEAELRSAENEMRRATGLNQRAPNSIRPAELARLAAERDFARAKLAKARHLADESPLSVIQFEIEQLREDVQELRFREAMSPRGT